MANNDVTDFTFLTPFWKTSFSEKQTETPNIDCAECAEGATELPRQIYGYVLISLLVAGILGLMGWVIFKKYNKDAHEKLLILQERSADTVKGVFNQRSYQRRLQALKPKLEVIEKRMQALEREKKLRIPWRSMQ